MPAGFAGTALTFAYFLTAAASVPIALLSVVVAWRLHSFPRALVYVLVGTGGLSLLGAALVAGIVGPGAGVTVVGALATVAVGLVALPLGIGRSVVARYIDAPPGVALRWTTLSWPVAMAASLAWYVGASPGPIGRYNITFLEGPAFVLAGGVFLAIVWLGPGALGVTLARRFGRDRDRDPEPVEATGGRAGVPPTAGGSDDRD